MSAAFIDNLLHSLSWTFIHSLWQGLILTILAGIVIYCTRKVYASVRYGILSILFFLFIGAVSTTFMIEWNTGTVTSPGLRMLENLADTKLLFNQSIFGQYYITLVVFLNANAQWIVSAWLIVLLFKSASIIVDLFYVHKLRNQNLFSPSREWQSKFHLLSEQLGIRKKIAFMESALVKIPAVVGYFKPLVLIPAGVLTQLPAGEVESILLHELAHIRRHDYLVNFIQRVAELIFFFNPGLLWVSSLLRIERENCCDDLVISTTGNKAEYLNAIISFKEHSMKQSGYVLGLFGKQNLLLQRMIRLVHHKNRILSPVEFVFFITNIVIFVLLLSAMQKPEILNSVVSTPVKLSAEPLTSFAGNHAADAQTIISQELNPGTREPSQKLSRRPAGKRGSQKTTIFEDQSSSNEKILQIQEHSNTNELLSELTQQRIDAGQFLQDEYLKQINKDQFAASNSKDRELLEEMFKQADNDLIQSKILKLQLDKDRAQAERDRQQAQKDRLQAEKDRQQAETDRIIADRDREQADIDRMHAEKDKVSAKLDRVKKNSSKAEIDRKRI
ncbi:M56 family metallopeptidase [Flavitalea sp.]|nr:M56 family metallopeptidase [Flavitalea sp.]